MPAPATLPRPVISLTQDGSYPNPVPTSQGVSTSPNHAPIPNPPSRSSTLPVLMTNRVADNQLDLFEMKLKRMKSDGGNNTGEAGPPIESMSRPDESNNASTPSFVDLSHTIPSAPRLGTNFGVSEGWGKGSREYWSTSISNNQQG